MLPWSKTRPASVTAVMLLILMVLDTIENAVVYFTTYCRVHVGAERLRKVAIECSLLILDFSLFDYSFSNSHKFSGGEWRESNDVSLKKPLALRLSKLHFWRYLKNSKFSQSGLFISGDIINIRSSTQPHTTCSLRDVYI